MSRMDRQNRCNVLPGYANLTTANDAKRQR
jgi:hypothetical protein